MSGVIPPRNDAPAPPGRRRRPQQASGICEDGTWSPAFPGQRPPFPSGHTFSLRHGAHSEARIAPLARKAAAEALAELGLTDDGLDPELRDLIGNYGRSVATADLLWQWMDAGGMEALLTYHEDWQRAGGRARRLADRIGLTEARRESYRRELAARSRHV